MHVVKDMIKSGGTTNWSDTYLGEMSFMFSVGQRFSSFSELDNTLKRYEAKACCVFVVRNSRSIQAAQKRLSSKILHPDLKYNNFNYACHHGENIGRG